MFFLTAKKERELGYVDVIVDNFVLKEGHNFVIIEPKAVGCYSIQVIKETNSEQNAFEFNGEEVKGFDTKGNCFMIDAGDYEKVKLCYWWKDKKWVLGEQKTMVNYINIFMEKKKAK